MIGMIAALRFVGRSRLALMTRCKSESKIFVKTQEEDEFLRCGHSFSASAISEINKKLDAELERFARPRGRL
jgi:hypothetical protein